MEKEEVVLSGFIKYSEKIPNHIVEGFGRYLTDGILPGSFCECCLRNDLRGAISRADPINLFRINEIVIFLVMGMPRNSWGSDEKVEAWVSQGGLKRKPT